MNNLNEIALEAFKKGSDHFGEKILGVKDDLYYSTMMKFYSKIIMLENSDGSKCSSEVGIYLDGEMMNVVSGHRVFSGLPVTPSIKEELKHAERTAL
jgi:hypothetical protein